MYLNRAVNTSLCLSSKVKMIRDSLMDSLCILFWPYQQQYQQLPVWDRRTWQRRQYLCQRPQMVQLPSQPTQGFAWQKRNIHFKNATGKYWNIEYISVKVKCAEIKYESAQGAEYLPYCQLKLMGLRLLATLCHQHSRAGFQNSLEMFTRVLELKCFSIKI